MEALKLLIADSNEEFRLALAEALRTRYHVRCCRSGREALELLRRETPDILVLNLMLPELDGITLLEKAVAEGIFPMVLAATPLLSDYVLESAERLGIGYLMLKPCDVQAAAVRVQDLSRRLKPAVRVQDPHTLAADLLLTLGISTKHNGFAYMREAMVLAVRDPGQPITKVLYPEVARICGCKHGHVERSIRSALESAWDRRDAQIWQKYFPNANRRPTNTVFVSRMAEELRQRLEDGSF